MYFLFNFSERFTLYISSYIAFLKIILDITSSNYVDLENKNAWRPHSLLQQHLNLPIRPVICLGGSINNGVTRWLSLKEVSATLPLMTSRRLPNGMSYPSLSEKWIKKNKHICRLFFFNSWVLTDRLQMHVTVGKQSYVKRILYNTRPIMQRLQWSLILVWNSHIPVCSAIIKTRPTPVNLMQVMKWN